MTEVTGAGPASETVPHDLVVGELEAALHRQVSENVMLRARLAARDRLAAEAATSAAGTGARP